MTKSKLLLISALTFALPVSSAYAQEEEDTPMYLAMDEAGDSLKLLRKIDPEDYAGGAKATRVAHQAIAKCFAYIPAQVEKMPEGAEKVKAIADARRLLGESYVALCELELAYLEKDKEKIAAAIAKVKESRKVGHKAYND